MIILLNTIIFIQHSLISKKSEEYVFDYGINMGFDNYIQVVIYNPPSVVTIAPNAPIPFNSLVHGDDMKLVNDGTDAYVKVEHGGAYFYSWVPVVDFFPFAEIQVNGVSAPGTRTNGGAGTSGIIRLHEHDLVRLVNVNDMNVTIPTGNGDPKTVAISLTLMRLPQEEPKCKH